ncbi:MAG: ribosome small subunit-dependent GTPase A [Bacteroidales bacterium]|nr:ribosome small subunit-dependent GTPase A [Bacteroidales bacterium]
MSLVKGVVTQSFGRINFVRHNNKIYECNIRGVLRIKNIRTTNPVAVGDIVNFEINDENSGTIVSVEDRKNYIIRRSTNLSRESHIIAANIDQALLVVTLKNPVTTALFIDRFLVTAHAYRIPVILVFNKIDIYSSEEIEEVAEMMAVYDLAGYELLDTSVPKNRNINKLKEILRDKKSVISGHSGVGKSSLINAIDPDLNLAVATISEAHKTGRHTTSYAQMIPLAFGGDIIDTPGIRGFGIIDIEDEELYHFFPEIFKISHNCRFNNCQHVNEPDCAVIQAVEGGEIAFSRYNSYISILNDDNGKFRHKIGG